MHVLYLPRGRWIPTAGSRSRVHSAAGIHAQTTPATFPWWQGSSKHKWDENPPKSQENPPNHSAQQGPILGETSPWRGSATHTDTRTGLHSPCSGVTQHCSLCPPLQGESSPGPTGLAVLGRGNGSGSSVLVWDRHSLGRTPRMAALTWKALCAQPHCRPWMALPHGHGWPAHTNMAPSTACF